MKKIYSLLFLALMLLPFSSHACRNVTEKLSVKEAFDESDVVLQGKIIEIKEGTPDDFKPADMETFEARKKNMEKQGGEKFGQMVYVEPVKIWKGAKLKSPVIFINYGHRELHSCDWAVDVQVGDDMLIFAAKDGNYPVLPRGLDGKTTYTIPNMEKRTYTEKYREDNSDFFKSSARRFKSAIQQLDEIVGQ